LSTFPYRQRRSLRYSEDPDSPRHNPSTPPSLATTTSKPSKPASTSSPPATSSRSISPNASPRRSQLRHTKSFNVSSNKIHQDTAPSSTSKTSPSSPTRP